MIAVAQCVTNFSVVVSAKYVKGKRWHPVDEENMFLASCKMSFSSLFINMCLTSRNLPESAFKVQPGQMDFCLENRLYSLMLWAHLQYKYVFLTQTCI